MGIIARLVVVSLFWMAFAHGEDFRRVDSSAPDADAIELAELIVHGIETLQPGPMLWPLARQLTQDSPDFAFGYYLLSRVASPSMEADEALRTAYRLSAESSPIHRSLIRGVYFREHGHYRAAAQELQRAVDADPQNRLVRMTRAELLFEEGRWSEMEANLLKALTLDADTPRVWRKLGDCYAAQGFVQGALAFYRDALKRTSPQSDTWPLLRSILETSIRTADASSQEMDLSIKFPSR